MVTKQLLTVTATVSNSASLFGWSTDEVERVVTDSNSPDYQDVVTVILPAIPH